MKIAMIGPSYPFKGGISRYTTQLYRELAKRHNVLFCAFKRQYPYFIYPGKGDKDLSDTQLIEEGICRTIDSLNPFSWYSTAKRIGDFNPDVLIVPWWVMFWAPSFIYMIRKIKRQCKTARVVFVCHNVVAHEPGMLSSFLTRQTLKLGDGFIVHSTQDRHDLEEIFNDANIFQVEHPAYEIPDAQNCSRAEARQKLSISGDTLLFFGFVRPYKGLGVLLDALPHVLEKHVCNLVVAGEIWGDPNQYREQIERLGIGEHVRLVGYYVPEKDFAAYFQSSDLVVLPYLSATGSGVVKLAYSFDRPVVVTNVGSLPEAVSEGETGFIVESGNASSLAAAILNYFTDANRSEMERAVRRYRSEFGWDKVVERLEQLALPQADHA